VTLPVYYVCGSGIMARLLAALTVRLALSLQLSRRRHLDGRTPPMPCRARSASRRLGAWWVLAGLAALGSRRPSSCRLWPPGSIVTEAVTTDQALSRGGS